MWILKIKVYNESNFLNQLARKYGLVIYGYPLNSFFKGRRYYVTVAGKPLGEEKNKKSFFKSLKKIKQIINLEVHEDFGIMTVEQPIQIKDLYAPEIIYIEPIKVTPDSYQIYNIGCWDRKPLEKIINLKVPNLKVEILKFKQEKIKNISISKVAPELTDKQMNSFETAFNSGYYEFPRKIDLEKMAKIKKISISTFQAHLRKAEKKIMEFFFKHR